MIQPREGEDSLDAVERVLAENDVKRRELRFDSLDEAIADAEQLLNGYERAGNWDLSQVAGHLSLWLTYPVEGFPKMPLPLRPIFWAVRKTVGPKKLQGYIASRSFPAGKPTMPRTVLPPGGEEREAVNRMTAAARRLMAHTGPIVPSPVFGPMTKETALALQCVHCAHHLSFLVPKAP